MTQEERERIKTFVGSYDDIHNQMDLMQLTINELVEKRNALLDRVDSLKEEEKEFLEGLIEKYGVAAVTPNKLMEIAKC